MAFVNILRVVSMAVCVVAMASSTAWAEKDKKALPSDPPAVEKQSQNDQRDLLLNQLDALRQENQDLSLRLAALEDAAVPRAESSADSFSRLSIAVLGVATLLLALRVRKLK